MLGPAYLLLPPRHAPAPLKSSQSSEYKGLFIYIGNVLRQSFEDKLSSGFAI